MLSDLRRKLLEEELQEIEERIENYKFSERNITRGAQGYTVGGHQKQNASLKTLADEIEKLQNKRKSILLQLNGESNRGVIRVQPTMK